MRSMRRIGSRLALIGALGPLGGPFILPAESAAQPALADAEAGLAAEIAAAVDLLVPEIVAQRHHIHRNPELGNREFETAKLVADHLRSLGFDEVRTEISHTGVVGILRGGKPGPIVAVRADMDALPVTERTDLPFRSTVRTTYLDQEVGVMHACGHDIHTSVELGVAAVLASLRDELPGTVMFIFQPAEEGPPPGEEGGAELMVADGVLDDPAPEVIFGLHASPELDVGSVGYTPGPALAAVDHFYIEILGTQSHGAWPHNSVDPVVMAAQAIEALQTIRSRNMPPLEPGVVSIGIVRGGERFNIIPERVQLEGTVRTYDPEVRDLVERRMGEMLDGVTSAAGGSYELVYDRVTPSTFNDVALSERMAPTMEAVVGAENVIRTDPTMGGEDFAFFSNEIPGFFYWLGTTKPGTESGGLHTPTYRGDDEAVRVGMLVMSNLIVDYLMSVGE
ncbi:MAG: amidohydrolase [Gemmatimonadales bacterium]